MIPEIEKQRRIAIPQTVSWYTVLIDVSLASNKAPNWGTGSIVKFKERLFILTCKHVVKEEYDLEQIRYFFGYGMEQKWMDSKDDIKKISMAHTNVPRTSAVTLPVVQRFYSDDTDDLVLLELDPALEIFRKYDLYDMELGIGISPKIDDEACLMGFSRELIQKATSDRCGCYIPSFLASTVVEKEINDPDYDKKRHFLIEYEKNEKSVDIHGLSGCGIWIHIVPEKQEIWTTNLRLLGVQTGIYEKSEMIIATRIERVFELLK